MGFTVPRSFYQRTLRNHMIAVGIGAVLGYATIPQLNLVGLALILLVVVTASYLLVSSYQKHVWVSVTEDGIDNGRVHFGWDEPVALSSASESGFTGTSVHRSSSKRDRIFIPDPILHESSFIAAVKRSAPSEHPLRDKITNAT